MKIFSLIGLLFLAGCGFSQNDKTAGNNSVEATQNEPVVKHVNVQKFKELVDKGEGIVLDVRTPEEVASGHILNASTINFYDADFEKKVNLMQKDKEIYIYCLSGGRSANAAAVLEKNGFKSVYNMEGGIMAWKKSNFPLTQPENKEDTNIKTFALADFKELLANNEVVLVDFHTVWCAPCKKMAPVIDEIEKEFEGKAIVKRVDVDKSSDVGAAYGVAGVPLFTIFVNGEAKWKHNGMIAKEDLVKELNSWIK